MNDGAQSKIVQVAILIQYTQMFIYISLYCDPRLKPIHKQLHIIALLLSKVAIADVSIGAHLVGSIMHIYSEEDNDLEKASRDKVLSVW